MDPHAWLCPQSLGRLHSGRVVGGWLLTLLEQGHREARREALESWSPPLCKLRAVRHTTDGTGWVVRDQRLPSGWPAESVMSRLPSVALRDAYEAQR